MEYKDAQITKTDWDGKTLTVDLSIGTEAQTIKGIRRPHSDLFDALKACVDIFVDHMEIPEKLRDRLRIVSVQYKETDKSSGYIVTAILHCPGTDAEIKMKSSFLSIPSDGFFDRYDFYTGDEIHDPAEYLYYLTDDEIAKLDKVLMEGYLYVKEGKRAPDPTPDLFGGEMEVEPMPTDTPQLEAPDPLQLEYTGRFLGDGKEGA